jgi:hypothetical protein
VKKISAAILDYAKPVLDELPPDAPFETRREALSFAIVIWNALVVAEWPPRLPRGSPQPSRHAPRQRPRRRRIRTPRRAQAPASRRGRPRRWQLGATP